MIRPTADLGRYRLGQEVPLFLACADAAGVPSVQSALPTATVYTAAGAVVATVRLAPADPAGPGYVFSGAISLGAAYASARFLVVYRYRAGNSPGLATAAFAVVGGGDAGGRVIALHSLDRPEARYVLGQLSGGALVQGRNPKF